jgi:hypothetical protein
MADEKKPKIDLKTRLQKMGGAVAPATGSGPAIPAPGRSVPPPPPMSSVPAPMGIPAPHNFQSSHPTALDPNNPLAAAAAGNFRSNAPAAREPPAPHRIEVDEGAVHDARKGVRNKMLVLMVGVLGIGVGIGWAAGNGSSASANRARAKQDALQLKDAVGKAKDSLTQLADKLQAGQDTLLKDKKFPDTLGKDLAGINVDFDGSQLGGRHFDGMGNKTTGELVDFVTRVQGVNDRKRLIQGLLAKTQKPITDALAAAGGPPPIAFVVVIDRDRAGEGAYLAALQPPFVPTKDKPNLPDKLTFLNPRSGQGNVEMPKYTGGDIKEKAPVAMPVVPATLERAFPSADKGQIAQLVTQLVSVKDLVRRDKAGAQPGDLGEDVKADMLESAQILSDDLAKAAQ